MQVGHSLTIESKDSRETKNMRRFIISLCAIPALLAMAGQSNGQIGPTIPRSGESADDYSRRKMFDRINELELQRNRSSRNGAIAYSYGAIAYSNSTGAYGYAWGQATRADAERVALRNCDGSDASIKVHGHNAWIAFAHGSDGASGWAWSDSSAADARKRAAAHCAKHGAVGRIQGASLHTSSGRTWAKFEAQGPKPAEIALPQTALTLAQLEEHFVPHIGIYYKKVYYQDGTFGAQLTRDAVPSSPATQIRSAAFSQPIRLERGDTIFELDGQRFRTDDDVKNHRYDTTMRLIDSRTGRTIAGSLTLP